MTLHMTSLKPVPHPVGAHPRRGLRLVGALALGIAALASTGLTWADGRPIRPATDLPLYRQECSGCHLAYPPGLLPAASWSRVMSQLSHHYGTDASLTDAEVRQIGGWLQAHAGTYKRVREEPPQDRITRSAWFERKHRQFGPQSWQHPEVKSAANCMACHTRADKGDYDDDNVTLPKGLVTSARSRGEHGERRHWLENLWPSRSGEKE